MCVFVYNCAHCKVQSVPQKEGTSVQTSRNRSCLMSRNQSVSVDALKVCMPALPLDIINLVSHPLPADLL